MSIVVFYRSWLWANLFSFTAAGLHQHIQGLTFVIQATGVCDAPPLRLLPPAVIPSHEEPLAWSQTCVVRTGKIIAWDFCPWRVQGKLASGSVTVRRAPISLRESLIGVAPFIVVSAAILFIAAVMDSTSGPIPDSLSRGCSIVFFDRRRLGSPG